MAAIKAPGGTMRRAATITAALMGLSLSSFLAGAAGATPATVKPHVALKLSDISHDKIKADISRSVYAPGDTWKSAVISWGDGQSSKLGRTKNAEHFYRLATSRQGYTKTLTIKITTREHHTLTLKHALRLYNVPVASPVGTPAPIDTTISTIKPNGYYQQVCDSEPGGKPSQAIGFSLNFPYSQSGNTTTSTDPYTNYTATVLSGTPTVTSTSTADGGFLPKQGGGQYPTTKLFTINFSPEPNSAAPWTVELAWDAVNTGNGTDGHHTYDITFCPNGTADPSETQFFFYPPMPPTTNNQIPPGGY